MLMMPRKMLFLAHTRAFILMLMRHMLLISSRDIAAAADYFAAAVVDATHATAMPCFRLLL